MKPWTKDSTQYGWDDPGLPVIPLDGWTMWSSTLEYCRADRVLFFHFDWHRSTWGLITLGLNTTRINTSGMLWSVLWRWPQIIWNVFRP